MTDRSDDPDRTARPNPDRKAAAEAERAARRAARQAERAAHKAQRQAERQALSTASLAKASERNAAQESKAAAGSPASAAPPARASDRTATRPTEERPRPTPFDILIVAQGGGIDRQAALLAASLRRNAPGFPGRLIVAEPQPEAAWAGHATRMSDPARAALTGFGAEIRPLVARDFGASYPHGNKIEALGVLEPGRPFLFLDSDTLILGDIGAVPFDFARPAASMRRTGTWPSPPLYGPGHHDIWAALYDRFGLDIAPTLDRTQPDEHWERFLYFNAGWFFGADPAVFGQRFRDWAVAVRDDPGEALACQSLDPWLDQIVLPLVIHSLGGGRPGPELAGMDGNVTCHWRRLPLLYARESDRAVAEIEALAALPEIAPLIDGWEAGERLISAGLGRSRIRPMFADARPLPPERAIRKRLRAEGLWLA
ncbi:hypothetical protein ACFHYO_10320 [Paracoccus panacisoli]|uniref:Glycosyl transferase family 8 n=1 Tax=Paracoccus panacisoli TaxID=1510163 RepID=A0ABV6T944_9RHOB